MAFVKVVKNKAYFMRYQVKYRRRREGKTDYYARRSLITQDKDKYGARKYRLVVRRTNKRVICQVVWSTIQGDRVMASADSLELKRFGLKAGFTNYAAAYCTGLLVARRLLRAVGLDTQFKGTAEASGEEYHVEDHSENRRPFKCILDVGLVATTTGNRVFGAMKGACDGGLHVPHSNRRFPGYVQPEDKGEGQYDAEAHKVRIFGGHVAAYMRHMQDDNPDKYEQHFSRFVKSGVAPDSMEAMYKKVHAAIRATPEREAKKVREPAPVHVREGTVIKTSKGKYERLRKYTLAERKERVQTKIRKLAEQAANIAAAAAQ
jgi:large subunit ribosomal protein L5e